MFKAAIALVLASACSALAVTLNVPGTANPWLAGRTNGFAEAAGDSTPANSPVLFTNFTTGAVLHFHVPDADRAGFAPGAESGPEGVAQFFVNHAAELGIGAIENSLANALLGVFLDDSQPDASALTPSPYSFVTEDSRNYLELRPALAQPFFIGNGTTTNGVAQAVIAPAGATRLFLGITDGSGWDNNPGSFNVDVTLASPPPNYLLTLKADPAGSGSIIPSPGPGADGTYLSQTAVQLSATPNQGYYLQSWSGADSSNGETAEVIMSGPRSVTASFAHMDEDPFHDCFIDYLYDFFRIFASAAVHRQTLAPSTNAPPQVDVTLLRAFRDQVLSRTTQGQAIINLFYRFSPEIIFHAAASPELRSLAAQAIVGLQPVLRDMLTGNGEMVVSSNQVSAVNALLAKLSEVGGVGLRSAIQSQIGRVGSVDSFVGKTSAQARLLVAGIQLQITSPTLSANGKIQFTITGVFPAGTLHAEYSDDFSQWHGLDLAPVTALPAMLQDDLSVAVRHRYYRVVLAP